MQFPLRRLSSATASETAKNFGKYLQAANIALIDEWGIFAENVGMNILKLLRQLEIGPHSNNLVTGVGVGEYCLHKGS